MSSQIIPELIMSRGTTLGSCWQTEATCMPAGRGEYGVHRSRRRLTQAPPRLAAPAASGSLQTDAEMFSAARPVSTQIALAPQIQLTYLGVRSKAWRHRSPCSATLETGNRWKLQDWVATADHRQAGSQQQLHHCIECAAIRRASTHRSGGA